MPGLRLPSLEAYHLGDMLLIVIVVVFFIVVVGRVFELQAHWVCYWGLPHVT